MDTKLGYRVKYGSVHISVWDRKEKLTNGRTRLRGSVAVWYPDYSTCTGLEITY